MSLCFTFLNIINSQRWSHSCLVIQKCNKKSPIEYCIATRTIWDNKREDRGTLLLFVYIDLKYLHSARVVDVVLVTYSFTLLQKLVWRFNFCDRNVRYQCDFVKVVK